MGAKYESRRGTSTAGGGRPCAIGRELPHGQSSGVLHSAASTGLRSM